MRKPERIARQSRRPSGWLGEIVGRVMALETAKANRVAVEQLGIRDGESILEVGCGHGRTLAHVARSRCDFLAGIDASDGMVRLARRRLRRWVEAGRAEISVATSDALPYADARFDAVLGVHVLYFSSDGVADLREIRRILRPGGRVVLGYRPRDPEALGALPATVYSLRSVEEVEARLVQAGFEAIQSIERTPGRPRFVCTQAVRPSRRAG